MRLRRTQDGQLLPLAALIPALVAAGKAAASGGISGGTGYSVKKGLEAASHKRQRLKINQTARRKLNSEAEQGFDANIKDKMEVHCLLFLRMWPRSGTCSERTKGIRKWVQGVSPAVTTDILHL